MSYEASIVLDSVASHGGRITTFQLKYPRMIHSEFMTHRMFSRNASSTRAIPTAKMIEWVEKDPAMPVYWGKNQKGMQATQELSASEIEEANFSWLQARDEAVFRAKELMHVGVHKQIAGRILEPWAHINVVVTATSFDNFFSLRCDKNAMPEIQALAVRMARTYRDSKPVDLAMGMWHMPYVTDDDKVAHSAADCLTMSVARCARVSYLTMEGKPPYWEDDIILHDRLEANGHWSPFEHPARPSDPKRRSGNFVGFDQYRQALKVSVHEKFDYSRLDEFEGRDFIV